MYAGIAGLRTHMQNLNVIGNNIANVNTTAYKAGRSVFRTSIYTTTTGGSNGTTVSGGINPSQIGYGSNMSTVDIDMSTGNYSVTGNPTDCMLDGEGFFLVGNKDLAQNFTGTSTDVGETGAFTSLTLTRTGDFNFMADGYFCDSQGNTVYGFLCTGIATAADVAAGKATKVGDAMFSDQLVPIRKPRVYKDVDGGMHIGYPTAGGGVQDAVTGNPQAGIEAIKADSLLDDYKDKVTAGAKEDDPHLLDYGTFKDSEGNIVDSGLYSLAEFNNITIDQKTGIITGTCKDLGNQTITIGCIAIGSVSNPNGVTQTGSTYYQAGRGSGDLVISAMGGAGESMGVYYVNGSLSKTPATGSTAHPGSVNETMKDGTIDGARLRDSDTGVLTSGLEMSKTDLAQEIANMILTQRGYQANTRIITVTDSMLEELVNMKR